MMFNRLLALVLLLVGPAVVRAAEDAPLKAGVFDPPRQAPDFTLHGSDGAELQLSRYRGRIVVLAFGFTHCTDVCPTTLAVLAQARKRLVAERKDFQVVYITVDPERDDSERMRLYLANFDATFIGGTGTARELEAVRNEYGILAEKKAASSGYSVAHSSFTYLIDRNGRLRALMPFGHSAEDYVHDVRILLGE